MRIDYLDHTAMGDDLVVVYLIIQVPDGRVLLHKNEAHRKVPRFPSDWQSTLSKTLMRGRKNKAALEDMVFVTFSWPKDIINNVKFLLRYGQGNKTFYIYLLRQNDFTWIQPGRGAEFRALPWDELVQYVLGKQLQFSKETHAVVDIINSHSGVFK